MKLKEKPIELKQANEFVDKLHSHHSPVYRDKFRLACFDGDKMVGVIQCGRPLSRYLDDGKTIEVVRCCSDGTYNACSFMYSKMARISKELGYDKIITYILEDELGTSLKASGWVLEDAKCGGKNGWSVPSRPREVSEKKYPIGKKKQRWVKYLNT